jgi:hypothetical protein
MNVKKLLRWLLTHWKQVVWCLVCLICLGIFGLLWHGDQETVGTLTAQLAAERWETEEKPYAQATVFLETQDGISGDSIGEIRLSVENALTASGVPSAEYPWFYGLSRMEETTLTNGTASSNVELTLVTGDYFRIHPMSLRTGWYMSEDDVMHDRIILDRQTAWDLFYSDNVVGEYLEWNGSRYQVAAVVDTEPGKYNDLAAEGTRRAWVYADSPGAAEETAGFTCIEMVLPQPVSGFAASTLQSVLENLTPEGTTALDNSGRFSLKNRWSILRSLSTRGISDSAIPYPYYENAARLVENRLALRLIPEGICLGIPLISLLILLLWLNHRRTWGLHSIPEAVSRAIDRRNARNYEARLRGEEPRRRRRPVDGLDYSNRKYGRTKRR